MIATLEKVEMHSLAGERRLITMIGSSAILNFDLRLPMVNAGQRNINPERDNGVGVSAAQRW